MVNRIVKNPDVQLAEDVLRRYAHDLEGLTPPALSQLEVSLSDEEAVALLFVLGRGKEGEVTLGEKEILSSAGFSDLFINELSGKDGLKALRMRASWLGDHFTTKLWRFDFSRKERVLIAQELGAVGMFPQEAFPELLNLREEGLESVIGWEIALEMIGAAFVVPHLMEGLSSPDRTMRFNCISALASVFAEKIPSTAPLISLLKDEDVEIRRLAARALGKRAAKLYSGMDEFLLLLENENPLVRLHAHEALDIFVAFAEM